MAQIKLNIPDNIYENLKQKALEEDRSVSNYINRVLKLHITNTNTNTNTTLTSTKTNNKTQTQVNDIREEELINDPYYDPNF